MKNVLTIIYSILEKKNLENCLSVEEHNIINVTINNRICLSFFPTIFGGLRMAIRKDDKAIDYSLNWCLGKEYDLIETLINHFIEVHHSEIEEKDYPFCSRIKPLRNDSEFLILLKDKFQLDLTKKELK